MDELFRCCIGCALVHTVFDTLNASIIPSVLNILNTIF